MIQGDGVPNLIQLQEGIRQRQARLHMRRVVFQRGVGGLRSRQQMPLLHQNARPQRQHIRP
ncbi:hypothetical protein SE16_04505 [Ardenticatena maritima]|uniref:Uncharacterized protein n=1 Tax=Ardenticatena maritima TaxID=872965 RepID=A0A0N8GSL9_9CHLR|nr:hypothetical protein SE16_04505 [Ardenticatena maritima]